MNAYCRVKKEIFSHFSVIYLTTRKTILAVIRIASLLITDKYKKKLPRFCKVINLKLIKLRTNTLIRGNLPFSKNIMVLK